MEVVAADAPSQQNVQDEPDRLDLLEPVPTEKRVQLQCNEISAWVPAFITPPNIFRRCKDWLTSRRKRDMLTLKPTSKPKELQILHRISASCEPGEVIALMGPSGSGKTSLLTILGGRTQKMMRCSGDVVYNGKQITKALRRRIGFVLQDDLLYETLTVYETLYYAAMLRLPDSMPAEEKVQRVDSVIQALGLDSCRNTIVGGFFRKGISGGERKRCSIGHELLINPSLLFLDEPTSGLDSTVSMHVLTILRQLARGGRAVVTTIHQPSSRLYLQLDKLLLLSKGHTLYYGSARLVVEWCDVLGYPLPYMMNVADFMLDLASGEVDTPDRSGEAARQYLIEVAESFVSSHPHDGFTATHQLPTVTSFANAASSCGAKATLELLPTSTSAAADLSPMDSETSRFDQERQKDGSMQVVDLMEGKQVEALDVEGGAGRDSLDKEQRWGASYGLQFSILFRRALKTRRFETLSVQDFVLFIVVGMLSGAFWWQRGQSNTVASAGETLGLLFFELMFLSFRTLLSALFTFPQEYKMMLKERASGMYRLSAFYFARLASDLPMDTIIPIIFINIIYFMGGLRRTGAGYFFANLASVVLGMFVAQSWGILLGVAVMNPKTAQTIAAVLILTFVLTAGYFVRNIPSWISWLKYTSFIFYAFGLLLRVEFKDRTLYQCVMSGSCVSINVNDPQNQLQQCSPVPGGVQEALGLNQNPDSNAQLARNICVLLGMLVALRIISYVILRKKTARR